MRIYVPPKLSVLITTFNFINIFKNHQYPIFLVSYSSPVLRKSTSDKK